jgi:hypothetical protein
VQAGEFSGSESDTYTHSSEGESSQSSGSGDSDQGQGDSGGDEVSLHDSATSECGCMCSIVLFVHHLR